jgi:hypothetical protein
VPLDVLLPGLEHRHGLRLQRGPLAAYPGAGPGERLLPLEGILRGRRTITVRVGCCRPAPGRRRRSIPTRTPCIPTRNRSPARLRPSARRSRGISGSP